MKEGQQVMKGIVIKGLVLCLFFLAGTLSGGELKGPRIEVKQENYDMGTVVEGKQAVHVFVVRNAGNESLMIERLQPS
jgi:hypothetical protein